MNTINNQLAEAMKRITNKTPFILVDSSSVERTIEKLEKENFHYLAYGNYIKFDNHFHDIALHGSPISENELFSILRKEADTLLPLIDELDKEYEKYKFIDDFIECKDLRNADLSHILYFTLLVKRRSDYFGAFLRYHKILDLLIIFEYSIKYRRTSPLIVNDFAGLIDKDEKYYDNIDLDLVKKFIQTAQDKIGDFRTNVPLLFKNRVMWHELIEHIYTFLF